MSGQPGSRKVMKQRGMTDLHCHILPGVDDGARDPAEACRMLDSARHAGIREIVATPHLYHVRKERLKEISDRFDRLKEAAARRGQLLRLGYEVRYTVLLEIPEHEIGRFCTAGTNELLLELPDDRPFPGWEDWIRRLGRDYRIRIAHPERCRWLRGAIPDGADPLVSATDLKRWPLDPARMRAVRLLKSGAEYASDAHSAADYEALQSKLLREL